MRHRVAIVGSGPAGLSAAARAAALGMSHVLLERTDHLSDTIFKYQKGKHVMATPSQLVLRSDVQFEAGKREAILAQWDEDAAQAGIHVRFNAEVTGIAGAAGGFTLTLAGGDTIEAEAIVLAIGTQGNPNRLRVPGAELPHVQYQLDDPTAYIDEHITVIGSGDAGIENALGLAADPEQRNIVTILNRGTDFARAKEANVKALMAARDAGRVQVMLETSPLAIQPGEVVLDTADGEARIPCNRVIARMGSAAPRAFLEKVGIAFTSPDREAFPQLSPGFESSVPGIFVVGALAGYPLIKHCMNQGYDVIEFIAGNTTLKPADEPILAAKFAALGADHAVDAWLELIRTRVGILNDLSPLQMREFMLDSDALRFRKGEIVFEKGDPGATLFAIVQGAVDVLAPDGKPVTTIPQGSIVGEVGLVSGRPRGATVRASTDALLIEVPRMAALKLMASVPGAKAAVTRISVERQLLQMFGSALQPEDLDELLASYAIEQLSAGQVAIQEGDTGTDIFVIRRGSMIVEKEIAGKPVFLSYLSAGSYFGEMAVIDGGKRTATVRAAIRSELIRLDGNAFVRLMGKRPKLFERARGDISKRRELTAFVEASKNSFSGAVDMYSAISSFLVNNGIGEATDVLLIDEKLCIGCDNCEKACADSHDGLSRLDREAGKTFANLHVPTSCRHCEHPHCMADCPPNAIRRGQDGEVSIDDSCIGCGNCVRNCPYGVIRLEQMPPKKPWLIEWFLLGRGPGPGEPSKRWSKAHAKKGVEAPKKAIKCDMCAGLDGGPSCVRACPTGAAIRVGPEEFLNVARLQRETS